jgi:hypothetical protein
MVVRALDRVIMVGREGEEALCRGGGETVIDSRVAGSLFFCHFGTG